MSDAAIKACTPENCVVATIAKIVSNASNQGVQVRSVTVKRQVRDGDLVADTSATLGIDCEAAE